MPRKDKADELEYGRQWRDNNKARIAANNKAYYEAHKEQCRAATRKWITNNKVRFRNKCAQWKADNPDKLKAIRLKRVKSGKVAEYDRKYQLANKEKCRKNQRASALRHREEILQKRAEGRNTEEFKAKSRAYYLANKEAIIARTIACARAHPDKRRTVRKRRSSKIVDEYHLRRARLNRVRNENCSGHIALLKKMRFCRYCFSFVDKPTIDHVIPIARGGCHVPRNLVACCGPCNSSKRDLLIGEWQGRKAA